MSGTDFSLCQQRLELLLSGKVLVKLRTQTEVCVTKLMHAQPQSDGKSVWRLDPDHSSVEFSIKKLFFFTVTGRFTDLDGSIVLDEKSVHRSSVEASVAARSVSTRNQQRDRQLRLAAFLDATTFPQIRFQSTEVMPGKDRDMLRIKGALTIKDTSKEVVLDVTEVDRSRAPSGEEVIYYVAETALNRFDFGVNGWRGLIAQQLKVVINVQANRESL